MTDDADRLHAFGVQLLDVHRRLRDELAARRAGSDASLTDLRTGCLAFCSALDRHHTGEDDAAFPALESAYPEFGPTLVKLREDHAMVATLLDRLRELTTPLGHDAGADTVRRVRGEIDGISAIVESHFRFEERTIVDALNALDIPAWRDDPPSFLTVGPLDEDRASTTRRPT